MNPLLKPIIGFFFLLIAAAITLGLLFTDLTEKSFYDETGTVSIEGINSEVKIYKDNFGVPYVHSQNEEDMYFSMGYMHAQDRLWQMDLTRRVAEGRLSEILGKDVLDYDILFRTLGIYKTAYDIYPTLSEKSKQILDSYCKGVNAFIENHSAVLPLEFDVLNYKPEYWKPEHSLMVVRMMGWELNQSWYTDYLYGELINKFGPSLAKEFIPSETGDGPFVIKGGSDAAPQKDTLKESAGIINNNIKEKNYSFFESEGSGFFNILKSYRKDFSAEGTGVGSNAWVVSGRKSESGKPILANDTHLSLSVPAKWYEIYMTLEPDGSRVGGFSLPGAPGIVIGSNNVISWGITNLMNDDSDFYILNLDGSDRMKYSLDNQVLTLDSTVEAIKVKGETDDHYHTTYSTTLGPVVSGLEKSGFQSERKVKDLSGKILVFKWTGYDVSDEIDAVYKINTSVNWGDFRNALRGFGTPGLNLVYADTMGNIGYQAAGFVPVRKNITDVTQAYYPSGGEITWDSYVPFDNLPQTLNPDTGYIVSANNLPLKNIPYYISNHFEPDYRAFQIEKILNSRNTFSPEEFKLVQNNVSSQQAREWCSYIFDTFTDSVGINMEYLDYLKLLKEWDYEMRTSSPAAMLFAQFEIELYFNLYQSRMGEELFKEYAYVKGIPVRNTAQLLKKNSSVLFKPGNLLSVAENRDRVVRKSFYDAVNVLRQRSGEDELNNWVWGLHHKVLMRHPLGSVPALGTVLNIGPYDINGNGTTISNSEYSFTDALSSGEYMTILAPSMRMIVDMSKPANYYTIITTGESGQPLHPNFRDQARLWLNGEYKSIKAGGELKKDEMKLLTLTPKKAGN